MEIIEKYKVYDIENQKPSEKREFFIGCNGINKKGYFGEEIELTPEEVKILQNATIGEKPRFQMELIPMITQRR